MNKWDKLHRQLDQRFEELNYDPMDDCPGGSYDRFFLSKGLLVTVDLPFRLPEDAKICNDGESVPGKLYDRNKKIAFVFYQSRAINKWMREHNA